MSYLVNVKELRNRMLACNKSAHVSVDFLDDDVVVLRWASLDGKVLQIELQLDQLSINNRVYERAMHKAKRDMCKWS